MGIASSGAFDSTTADRGVGIETAADENALRGLEYPSEERTLELERADNDGGGGCFFVCTDFRYNDRDIVLLEDNSPAGELTVESIALEVDENDIAGGSGIRHESTDGGLRIVLGDFRCPSTGLIGTGTQRQRSATADILVSDGSVSIALERAIDIECIEG